MNSYERDFDDNEDASLTIQALCMYTKSNLSASEHNSLPSVVALADIPLLHPIPLTPKLADAAVLHCVEESSITL